MPTSRHLLDALKVEKSAPRDIEAIQRNHPHYKHASQASKKDDSNQNACATSGAVSEANQAGNSSAPLGKGAAKRAAAAQPASAQVGSTTQPKADREPVGYSTCSHAISVRTRRQASTRTCHQVKSHRQHLHLQIPPQTLAPRLYPHMHFPLCLQALTVLKDHGPCLDPPRGGSRYPSVVLPSRKAVTRGSAHPKRRKRKAKERVCVKDGVSNSKREGAGRRKEEYGRGAGLLQPCILASDLLLRSSSASLSSASPAHRSKARR